MASFGAGKGKGEEAGLRKVVGPAGGGTGRSWVTSSARPVSLGSAENGINVDGPASCLRSQGGLGGTCSLLQDHRWRSSHPAPPPGLTFVFALC